jgi:hypothetical protein
MTLFVQRPISRLVWAVCFSIFSICYSHAQNIGAVDGTWEGRLSWAAAPGLSEGPASNLGFSFRVVIRNTAVQVFTLKGAAAEEVKPGSFRLVRLGTNALVVAIDSGKDDDGTWVETWAFALTVKDNNTLSSIWLRQVNNNNLPPGVEDSKFSVVQAGEFKRVK